jgi:hypothetical protein
MIADAHPEIAPNQPRLVQESDEWLWENATEFCAALDRYKPSVYRITRARAVYRSVSLKQETRAREAVN